MKNICKYRSKKKNVELINIKSTDKIENIIDKYSESGDYYLCYNIRKVLKIILFRIIQLFTFAKKLVIISLFLLKRIVAIIFQFQLVLIVKLMI